jgi:hypothetical protein
MSVYCSRADIEALWNPADLLAAVDDDQDGTLSATELAHIDRAIVRAGAWLRTYLDCRYAAADLAASDWCRDTSALIAAYLLAGRSGGAVPLSLAEQWQWVREQLRDIRDGRLRLPGVPDRVDTLPRATNFRS